MNRSKTITWANPLEGAAKAVSMTGFDYLQAMMDGHIPLPPLLTTLDFEAAGLEPGQVSFSFIPQEFHYNPIGTVHGGVLSAILDSAMGCSLHSLLPVGTGYTTLELKVNFLKAVAIKTGPLRAMGHVINLGSRTALVDARLVDEAGTLYAYAVSTCLLLKA